MKDTFLERLFKRLAHYTAVMLQQGPVHLDADSQDYFFGIYRGIVTSNIDPDNLMRLQVKVPHVLESESLIFAQPCIPAVDSQLSVPAAGTHVWIMFEGGNRNQPVWIGRLGLQG